MGSDQSAVIVVCIRSFIEPDLFDNNDNTTPIYLISLLWKLGLALGLDLQLHYFRIFRGEQRKRAPYLPSILREVTSCSKNAPKRSTTK